MSCFYHAIDTIIINSNSDILGAAVLVSYTLIFGPSFCQSTGSASDISVIRFYFKKH